MLNEWLWDLKKLALEPHEGDGDCAACAARDALCEMGRLYREVMRLKEGKGTWRSGSGTPDATKPPERRSSSAAESPPR